MPKPLQNWTQDERIEAVKSIFNTITPTYDHMNHIMSAGRDIAWRRRMIQRLPEGNIKVLDIATGTGDVAIDIKWKRPDIEVAGIDFVFRMMEFAQQKTRAQNLAIQYMGGDALHLPFPDNSFDATTIAFGLRNIPDKFAALREMQRVVKPGGKVFTLEMTFPRNLKMRAFFTWYLNKMIPILGATIARDKKAYHYLAESIQEMIHPDTLSALYEQVGFQQIKATPLTFGITYLHEGTVA
ncbi:bifunctional demethylmenaquinone methyltransferase/2-methoxy-6-polyprenyl-1,4-benzoquinol methylase UbiE [bacterium]|nr:bifunctional demethylmenaquinone methyltransferase/2-methoxy-6-polyprenyl-1,4-benzoquinol methylase UbiE [bacterium]